jgi:hypothetical protein
MADRRAYGERHRSVLGRVDWACWLVVAALLGLAVLGISLQFPSIAVVTIILAILLVAFDSWVNRPKDFRARDTDEDDGYYEDDYLSQPIAERRPAPPAPNRARPQTPAARPPAQSPRPPAPMGRPQGGRPMPPAGDPRARSPRPPVQGQGQPPRPPFQPGRVPPPPTQASPPVRTPPPTRVTPPADPRARM